MAPGPAPLFWSTPIRYWRWAARERPAYFWSMVVGLAGPAAILVIKPIRNYVGDVDAPQVPLSYPIPTGPRKKLTGFDDDTES